MTPSKTQTILFRADASSSIGIGHIMRDLVLAKQYPNAHIYFATQALDGNINTTITQEGYTLKILTSQDKEELVALIKTLHVDLLIIDHYEIDAAYERYIKETTSVKILAFDDTYEKHHCDILLNHNISANKERYNNLVPQHCELRCGSKYTLLRDEFIEEKKKRKRVSSLQNIFVAMGGADHSNVNIAILKILDNFNNIHVDVITTTANKNLPALKKYIQNRPSISLHVNTTQMAKLLHNSDLAIATPSVIIHEILYMDIAFIAIKTASNQEDIYTYLCKHNYITLASFDSTLLKKNLAPILTAPTLSLSNFTTLSLDEKKMILRWRNNKEIQKWMFTQEDISLDNHLAYIDSLYHVDDKRYFLVKKGHLSIGVIDFTTITKESTYFGIYTNPDISGAGKLLLELIIDYAFTTLHVTHLLSEVFEQNHLAIKLYTRYNFEITHTKHILNERVLCMKLTKRDAF